MALFSYPVCTWLCQYVNMGVRKWLEKSAEKQKYKLCKTLNPLSRKAFRAVSFSATKDKTKGHPFGCPFVLGSAAQRAAPPFGISMLGGNEFRLRRGFACGKTPARRKGATGQKGRLGGSPIPFRNFKRSILTTPSTKRARRKPCPFLRTPRAEGLLRPSTRLVRHIGGRWLEEP